MKKLKSILKSIGEALFIIPAIILLILALIIMLPPDYIKYKRSPYYKKERKKYSLFAASGTHFEVYNTVIKHDLPIEYIPGEESDELQCGWFVRGETLIILDGFPFEYDAEKGAWNYCEYDEYEDEYDSDNGEGHDAEKEIMPLDEYVELQLSHINDAVQGRTFTDAVILVDEDFVEDNVDAAKSEPRFLVYSDSDNSMTEVLKRFCGVEDVKKKPAKPQKRRKKESAPQKELKGFAKILAVTVMGIFTLCVGLGAMFLLDCAIEYLLLPENYLFYEHTPVCSSILVPFIIVPSMSLAAFLLCTVGSKLGVAVSDPFDIVRFLRFIGKWLIPIGAVWLVATYACITSMTYVTSDSIVVTSPLDPKGQVYAYSDVERIECGFGDKKHAFRDYENEGSFYYKITVGGEERVFHTPTPNPDVERYEMDSYLELEELDRALTELGILKESSPKGYEECDFDKVYVDRFLRIIEYRIIESDG
ncbi:MAG: hypothetical protein IJ386_04245 [Clostridia bacterium]|nr:hypothetical protein [Clostridia bacterium]